MPRRELFKETYYHIYNRGWNKQLLFYEERDYRKFYANIEKYLLEYLDVQIFAYCFLPNHFHFLLQEEDPEVTLKDPTRADQISKFMNRVQQSYAAYFNAKYRDTIKNGRKRPIFEGRFQAKEITSEDYLVDVQVYIEHNAVKHELVDKTEDWNWTSYNPGSRSRVILTPIFR